MPMWVCPIKNECRNYVDVGVETNAYCNGVLVRESYCPGFVPKRVPQEVGPEQDLPNYVRIERAHPGYLVFFDGVADGWYMAFGRTALKLKQDFGYRLTNNGTTGIGRSNWEIGKRRYIEKGYGVLLMRGNRCLDESAPVE